MSTRRLRYFLAVAEYGHFGRAAEALYLSPTALSEQVRRLETELQVRLLDRNPRGAQLTPIGTQIVEQARVLLKQVDALADVVAKYRRESVGALRLGFVTMAAGELTPRIVSAFTEAHPGNPVELVHLTYARQFPAILAGEVDAAIVRGPVPATNLRSLRLLTEPRMVMLSGRHRLAGQPSVACEDLRDEVRVDTDGVPPDWRRWWSLDPRSDGTPPPYGPVVHSFDEQLEMAASGAAISIVPATAASVYHRVGVAFVPIRDAPPSEVLLCARADDGSAPLTALFAVCAALHVR